MKKQACGLRGSRMVVCLVAGGLSAGPVLAASLAPPPYEVMNRHGVNVATGHVSPSLATVSIGDGSLGLSHSISTFSSNFVNWEGEGPIGYRDKFYGRVMKVIHHKPPNTNNSPQLWVWVMRVFDIGGSKDFSINADGTYASYDGDPRHTLQFVAGTGFVWTKPDGTVTTFSAPNYVSQGNNYEIIGGVSSIRYPNGFAVTVTSTDIGAKVLGVSSNTGYQLRYVYVPRAEVLELPDDPANTRIPPVQQWSSLMPRYVAAINNAVDYCGVSTGTTLHSSLADACGATLSQDWPKATFTWPGGMPRVMYLGETVFSVADAGGALTEYTSRPFKKNVTCNEQDPNYRTPRIVAVKPAGATAPTITYEYDSYCIASGDQGGLLTAWSPGPVAQLKRSLMGSDGHGYSLNNPYTVVPGAAPTTLINGSGGYRAVNYVYNNIDFGLMKFDAWDKFVTFEAARSNRLLTVQDKLTGVTTELFYDARYNLNSIKKNGVVVQSAEYPATCDNRKTCNQATWMKDANGNRTDYEYDPNSGQVTRIRLPADKSGIRAETRFSYEPKYAYVKTLSGGFQPVTDPVYLLTRERKCLTTATLADGSGCAGGPSDEVIKDYDYGPAAGPNNLSLRGVAVTAYVDGAPQVRRTCFAYDVSGRRIGETTPNAGLASCP